MKDIPILYSTEMVRALLDGRKTQTRRLNGLENQNENPSMWKLAGDVYDPAWDEGDWKSCCDFQSLDTSIMSLAQCPYGQPGDILWVRESFFKSLNCGFVFKAGENKGVSYNEHFVKWKPNIHMPKTAARIFLQVKEIRVERLQDISAHDAKSEGVKLQWEYVPGSFQDSNNEKRAEKFYSGMHHLTAFNQLWESINGAESWNSNPWVWVISFERIEKPKNWPI